MSIPSLYSRILGPAFERLLPSLKSVHDLRNKRLVGRCDIAGGSGLLSRFIASVARLPVATADVPVEIDISCVRDHERWARMFGTQRMVSTLHEHEGRLRERIGAVVIDFNLVSQPDRIDWLLHRARLAIIPIPITWLLMTSATESIQDGRYHFEVSAHVRGVGLIVRYKGWLAEAAVR